MLEYYVIDVETNGFKANYHEMNEISIIRCSDRHQLTKFIKTEFPERSSPESLQITNKTYEDLLKGDSKEEVVKFCNSFIEQDGKSPEERCLVGHSVAFDRRFCHALWEQVGLTLPVTCWCCTVKLAKEWVKKAGTKPDNFKLHSILKFAKIKPMPGIHQSQGDAQNAYLFWKKAMENKINYVESIKRHPHILNGPV